MDSAALIFAVEMLWAGPLVTGRLSRLSATRTTPRHVGNGGGLRRVELLGKPRVPTVSASVCVGEDDPPSIVSAHTVPQISRPADQLGDTPPQLGAVDRFLSCFSTSGRCGSAGVRGRLARAATHDACPVGMGRRAASRSCRSKRTMRAPTR